MNTGENKMEEILEMQKDIVRVKAKLLDDLKRLEEYEKIREIWKPIVGYENYEISSFGRVRHAITKRIRKLLMGTTGYKCFKVRQNGKLKNIKIHQAVAKAFIPNPCNKPNIDHINNIKTDNKISNLRWVTNSENSHNTSIRSDNSSGLKGVSFNKRSGKWVAYIDFNRKRIPLGYFDTIEEAKTTRQRKSTELFGEFKNKCEF
jgi:hypothetical protein